MKLIFKFGFPLIASLVAISCGSVQLSSSKNEQWRQYLNLNDSICSIIMIVVGCIILISLLIQLAIKYLPANFIIAWIKEHPKELGKLGIGLTFCCAMLLCIAIALSFSDITSINDTDETALIHALDQNYVENSTGYSTNFTTSTTSETDNQNQLMDNNTFAHLQGNYKYATTTATTTMTPPTSTSSATENITTDWNFYVNDEFLDISNDNDISSTLHTMPLFNIKTSSETKDYDFSFVVDHLQQKLKCCGVESYTDWSSTDWGRVHPSSVPDSCCIKKSENCGINYESTDFIYTKGCLPVITRKIIKKAAIYIIISVIVILLDIISAKYEGILKICPSCLKKKVMARREKKSKRSESDDPTKDNTTTRRQFKENQDEDNVITQLTIHLYTGPVVNNSGKYETVGGGRPKTFTARNVPMTGSIRISATSGEFNEDSSTNIVSKSITCKSSVQSLFTQIKNTSASVEDFSLTNANTPLPPSPAECFSKIVIGNSKPSKVTDSKFNAYVSTLSADMTQIRSISDQATDLSELNAIELDIYNNDGLPVHVGSNSQTASSSISREFIENSSENNVYKSVACKRLEQSSVTQLQITSNSGETLLKPSIPANPQLILKTSDVQSSDEEC